MVPVEFIERTPPYHMGDRAAFPAHVADIMIERGQAKLHVIPPKELAAAQAAEKQRVADAEAKPMADIIAAHVAAALSGRASGQA